jgi:hypothetical protein
MADKQEKETSGGQVDFGSKSCSSYETDIETVPEETKICPIE